MTQAADEASPGRRSQIAGPGGSSADGPADPLEGGSAGRPSSAGCSWSRPWSCTACSSSSRSLLTVQYSLYRWDGVGPATWVGLSNYATVLSEPRLRRDAVQRLPARPVLQPRSGRARSRHRERHPARRDGSAGHDLPHDPVPSAGDPAGRRRASSGAGCCRFPDSSTRPSRRSGWATSPAPGSAISIRPSRPSGSSGSGSCLASARSCCSPA